ncbi:hypothetical protein ATANTOWER_017444 [Ataeniobius toweri]|uniref:Uncharacterized protein n=1 Tax=Ataeniobius toweri TaxID=208326 RepID=A0ABU7BRU0_9TELE|nr:hypothetical protein [Ataeniobius toweri]
MNEEVLVVGMSLYCPIYTTEWVEVRGHGSCSLQRSFLFFGILIKEVFLNGAKIVTITLKGSLGTPLEGEEFGYLGGTWTRATAPPPREESAEVAWTSWEVFQADPTGRRQGTVKDTLEGLCLSPGLVTPQAFPRGGVWGEGSLAVPAETATP